MTDISFYLLKSQSVRERYLFACKLIEKIYRSGQVCYVFSESLAQSQMLDDLLWTFRAGSFIPHQLYTGELPSSEQVILIGTQPAPEPWQKIQINLSSQQPEALEQAERIVEILDNNTDTKALARQRYRRYQQQLSGSKITTHNIA